MGKPDALRKVREEYKHLRWYYLPGKDDRTPNVYAVEAIDQYGRWYHATFSDSLFPGKPLPDRARDILRTLDKLRTGQPVRIKFNKLGVHFQDPGITEGKYDDRAKG